MEPMTSKVARRFLDLATREIWGRDDGSHDVDWKDDSVWQTIKTLGRYHRSDEIMISCGTVTVHKANSKAPKILVLYNADMEIYQLPKGRKAVSEGYIDAALRETEEESGVAVQPLMLRFPSRATPSEADRRGHAADDYGPEDHNTGLAEGLSNENIGVSEYPDPATGAWRNIHWFAARPTGSVERDETLMTLEDRRKLTTFWLTEEEALGRLKLDDEKFMVKVTVAYLSCMTQGDWIKNGL